MGIFGGPKAPLAPPMPPPSAHPAVLGSAQTQLAGSASQKAGAAAEGMGFDKTIQTSPQGLKAPETAKTTLLGK